MSSGFEGSPNVIIEAMATGLPIVATRVDGIPELVEEGKSGFLVEPKNPRALADALIAALTDESKTQAMGRAGRDFILEAYSLDKMVRRTERVILEAYQESSRRKRRLF
jgi:glycosyltransferase involved in cell wall biosynthesis